MKNKIKDIYINFKNIQYSFLKNLNSRKTKIQKIWHQINFQNKTNKSIQIAPKSKLKNQKVSSINFELRKLTFLKEIKNFQLKRFL